MKPDNPIVYNEFYLDAMTGGSPELPAPVTPEQHYLAHLAGMAVTLPDPIILRDKFLAKICGMDVNVPTYIPGKFPRKFAYYAKAAGQDVDVPQPITREEMYWFDYVSGQPSEKEYTGAVPVTFTANGQPLLDYLISGNTVQSGTPTPDSPVMPQGTGERTGNLVYAVEQGGITNTGDKTTNNVRVRVKAKTEPNTTYTFVSNALIVIISGFSGETFNDTIASPSPTTQYTFTTGAFDTDIYVTLRNADGTTIRPTDLSDVMLNIGSTAIPYEPYGIKIQISSADTTTPVYLGEVETTRKVKKLVLTGEENITSGHLDVSLFNIPISDYLKQSTITVISTHYIAQSNVNGWGDVNDKSITFYGNTGSATKTMYIRDSSYSTVADFKSYLTQQYAAGTPVTVWYVLATEETAVVNEPLMKIGDYADTLSMEQANVEIPTARGTNTLDVLSDVKPSEIYMKYKE